MKDMAMVAPSKGVDPRVKRTRQLLQHAFIELIQEKGIASISIQDITERATVNRATFYAHFPDKYALMDSILREQFQQRASSMLPSKPQWSLGCLRILIRAVFDFLKEFHHDCKPGDTQFDPMFERAVQQELHTILAGWLMQASLSEKKRRIPVDTVADVLSWAMFGTAVTWSRDGQTPSAEEMTRHVLLILTEGVAHLAPDLLPD